MITAIAWGVVVGGIGRFLLFLLFESGAFESPDDKKILWWILAMMYIGGPILANAEWGVLEKLTYLVVLAVTILIIPRQR